MAPGEVIAQRRNQPRQDKENRAPQEGLGSGKHGGAPTQDE